MTWLELAGYALRAARFIGARVVRSPFRELAIALLCFGGGCLHGRSHRGAPPAAAACPPATSSTSTSSSTSTRSTTSTRTSEDLAPTVKTVRTESKRYTPAGQLAADVVRVEELDVAPKRVEVQLGTLQNAAAADTSTTVRIPIAPAPATSSRAPTWSLEYAPMLLPKPDAIGLFQLGRRVAGDDHVQVWLEAYALPMAPAAGVGLRITW